MAVVRTPRESWIQHGLQALADGGPDSVRVEALARALGVTKGGFYWHFEDREALLAEMLEVWERMSVDAAIEDVESHGGDARTRLQRLFALAASSDLRTTDLAVRDWARRDPAVAERLHRVDNRRMAYVRPLFREFCADEDDVEARCLMAFTLFVGLHFVHVEHGGRRRSDVLQRALQWLLS
jgi:AcrR family transcriptional regulator